MNKLLMVLVSSLVLITPALAQGGTPDPAFRERMRAMQPIFDLTGRVSLMLELDAQPKLKITQAQAKLLLPVLKDLQTRPALSAKEATAILANIENKILTDSQLIWLDDTQLKRAEERRKQFESGGGAGGFPAAGGAGGPPPMFQAMQSGKPFNPFKLDNRAKKSLTDLIALLAKR